jgi:hypothetical protein
VDGVRPVRSTSTATATRTSSPPSWRCCSGCAVVYCQAVGGSAIQQLLATAGVQPLRVECRHGHRSFLLAESPGGACGAAATPAWLNRSHRPPASSPKKLPTRGSPRWKRKAGGNRRFFTASGLVQRPRRSLLSERGMLRMGAEPINHRHHPRRHGPGFAASSSPPWLNEQKCIGCGRCLQGLPARCADHRAAGASMMSIWTTMTMTTMTTIATTRFMTLSNAHGLHRLRSLLAGLSRRPALPTRRCRWRRELGRRRRCRRWVNKKPAG